MESEGGIEGKRGEYVSGEWGVGYARREVVRHAKPAGPPPACAAGRGQRLGAGALCAPRTGEPSPTSQDGKGAPSGLEEARPWEVGRKRREGGKEERERR